MHAVSIIRPTTTQRSAVNAEPRAGGAERARALREQHRQITATETTLTAAVGSRLNGIVDRRDNARSTDSAARVDRRPVLETAAVWNRPVASVSARRLKTTGVVFLKSAMNGCIVSSGSAAAAAAAAAL